MKNGWEELYARCWTVACHDAKETTFLCNRHRCPITDEEVHHNAAGLFIQIANEAH